MRPIFLAALLALPAFAFGQGSLTPTSAPAQTMKTLDQLEPRIPIGVVGGSFAALSIDSPGSYVLLGNLSVRGGTAITINADNVTLDLCGFTIDSLAGAPAADSEDSGIRVAPNRTGIAITNGHIRSSTTYGGTTFSKAGFNYGVLANSAGNGACRVSDLTVTGTGFGGIYVNGGGNSVVSDCTVRCVGGYGIAATTVMNCSAETCGFYGIFATTVLNCSAGVTYGEAIRCVNATNCSGRGQGSGASGIRTHVATGCKGSADGNGSGLVADQAATNCAGESADGIGLSTDSATNCTGVSTSVTGLSAKTALSCKGTSTSGAGIDATSVTACSGESVDGYGITCTVAADSFGSSVNSTGLNSATATNCYGTSNSGWGLFAQEATNCHGLSQSGTRGLHAEYTATGCYGEIYTTLTAGTNYGLYASVASNCRGFINTNGDITNQFGLGADIAENCYGFALRGNGLRAAFSALNCNGECNFLIGIGLYVTNGTANTCTARSGNSMGGYGVAMKAAIAIGCTPHGGTIDAPQKFLGTP